MQGTVAITDHGWYEFLLQQPDLDEVNFWTPSASHAFHAPPNSPFFFKLKAPYRHAICGYGVFYKFDRLPDVIAWEWFGPRNGCPTLAAMQDRIHKIREGMHYRGTRPPSEIGCILVVQPIFFSPDQWVDGPRDWPDRNLRPMHYDLTAGEGQRIWQECLARTPYANLLPEQPKAAAVAADGPRVGAPVLVQPRLGQGTFRVAVMDASYQRACAITLEHSVPALDASHIKAWAADGPNEVRNGILLRADLHRLFDQGYITVTPDLRLEVSARLRADYGNGRSYYPSHGSLITVPPNPAERPAAEFLRWHNDHVFLAA